MSQCPVFYHYQCVRVCVYHSAQHSTIMYVYVCVFACLHAAIFHSCLPISSLVWQTEASMTCPSILSCPGLSKTTQVLTWVSLVFTSFSSRFIAACTPQFCFSLFYSQWLCLHCSSVKPTWTLVIWKWYCKHINHAIVSPDPHEGSKQCRQCNLPCVSHG